jgi:hypothetical protein
MRKGFKRSIVTDPDKMVIKVEVVEVKVIVRVVGVRLFRGEEKTGTGWLQEKKELQVRIEEVLGKAYPKFRWSWIDVLPNNDIVFVGTRKDK